MATVGIVGAGVAGLAAAIRLQASGHAVTIFEKNAQVGGKMYTLKKDGFRWDTGPSVITMLPVFEDLFSEVGRNLEDYLIFDAVDPLTRYFFANGQQLDAKQDLAEMCAQIAAIAPDDVAGYLEFLQRASEIHRITGPVFIYQQPPKVADFLQVPFRDMLKVDSMRSMQASIESLVQSPEIRQLLGRFATYVGGSPYAAPATLNVIANVEMTQGVWYPRGGIYAIATALEKLARELGVTIHCDSPVTAIDVNAAGQATGITADGIHHPFAAVIANADVLPVHKTLLPQTPVVKRRLRKLENQQPSCSGFVMLLGVQAEHAALAHHNIFFSGDYKREFVQIFDEGVPPTEPTVYAAITSKSTPSDAPMGMENWFVLVNAPAADGRFDWETEAANYKSVVLETLAKHGIDLSDKIVSETILTPLDLQAMSGANRGALYGASANSRWTAFQRPHNQSAEVAGLFFAGGTTHPGGGIPMVTLSGKVAAQLAQAYLTQNC